MFAIVSICGPSESGYKSSDKASFSFKKWLSQQVDGETVKTCWNVSSNNICGGNGSVIKGMMFCRGCMNQ